MIEKEIYSPKAFLNILEHNKIPCGFVGCTLFKDYITYEFEMNEEKKVTEFQLYSVTFSVIIESENSCFFLGKNGKKLVFLLTFSNDLAKYGLKKTAEKQGKIPKETLAFDFVKMPLSNMVWYKFDTKELSHGHEVKEFFDGVKSAEERIVLDKIWKEVTI